MNVEKELLQNCADTDDLVNSEISFIDDDSTGKHSFDFIVYQKCWVLFPYTAAIKCVFWSCNINVCFNQHLSRKCLFARD